MKKTLLPALIVLLFFSSTTLAQLPFKLGVRAGLNLANLSFDPELPSTVDKSSRVGFKFGAMAELGFIPMFAIQVEPMYVMRGAKFTQGSVEQTWKFSYLEIPVLLKLKIPTPGPITPYAFAGPNIGILLSANDETNGHETDIKEHINSTDFALDFGAGVSFNIAPLLDFLIDGRYSIGLSELPTDEAKQSLGNLTVKTRDIQIVAGIMFGL
ncbi:MAG: porin family protein [Ignavibacteriaceae bacterium]|jgi:opacity protein-like surface antigen